MNVVLSRNFASAFGLTLICSLLGSYLAGFPYLEVIGALVISLILGMLAQTYEPAISYSQAGIGLISNKFLRLGIILLGFKLNLISLARPGLKRSPWRSSSSRAPSWSPTTSPAALGWKTT